MNPRGTNYLNSRVTDAANALHDAEAHLEGLRRADGADFHGLGGRPVPIEEMTVATRAREAAKAALDEANEALRGHLTAERIEAEDDARG